MNAAYELWRSGLEEDPKNLELAKALNLPKRYFFRMLKIVVNTWFEENDQDAFLILCEFYGVMPITKEGEQLTLFQ